ncbi:flagellar basal body-associated FliL family protein [Psychromonas sp. MME1]|uniref:flagellar basal body-associated FliL family protein n=1 Tax=Psychromonas sp. MME1 TaxID=3231032 RepID=UPI0034E1957E
MFKKMLFCLFCFSFFPVHIVAEEAATEEVNYYEYLLIDPDIITNYDKQGKRIGYIRVSVELMAKSSTNYALLARHEPLIRDKIITILGEQSEDMVKSIAERENIRLRCLNEINAMLSTPTVNNPLADLLFTKYLYE